MFIDTRTITLAAAGLIIWSSASTAGSSDPTGIWFDHNGRGAVEIAPCASGKGLCGYVVHIKDAKNNKRCGTQILGNVTPSGGGWIYSPDRGKKYSVALTRLSDEKLRVVGNAGSFFSKTFTWNRAPDDVARCGEASASAPVPAKPAATASSAPAPAPTARVLTDTPAVTGASSASVALLGAPKVKRVAAAAPVAAPTETPPAAAPAVTEEKQAAAEAPQESTENPVEESFVPERKCKFKIPYVGRVISVPCRD